MNPCLTARKHKRRCPDDADDAGPPLTDKTADTRDEIQQQDDLGPTLVRDRRLEMTEGKRTRRSLEMRRDEARERFNRLQRAKNKQDAKDKRFAADAITAARLLRGDVLDRFRLARWASDPVTAVTELRFYDDCLTDPAERRAFGLSETRAVKAIDASNIESSFGETLIVAEVPIVSFAETGVDEEDIAFDDVSQVDEPPPSDLEAGNPEDMLSVKSI